MEYIWKVVIMSVCAYFLGNISFARIISKKKKNDDITTHGSGNPGTSNVMRTHGAKLGFLVFFLDVLKGLVPALVGYFVCGGKGGGWESHLALWLVGGSAVIGHMYPVIFKFKGGKGVATAAGVAAVSSPIVLSCVVVAYWVSLYFIKVPASVWSFVAVGVFAAIETTFMCLEGCYYSVIIMYIIIILIIWKHRANIKRLFQKKESKADLKAYIQKDKEEKLARQEAKKKQQTEMLQQEKTAKNLENSQENNVGNDK